MKTWLVLIFIFINCGPNIRYVNKPHIKNSLTLKATYNNIWEHIIEICFEESYPIKKTDEERGLIMTDFMKLLFSEANDREHITPSVMRTNPFLFSKRYSHGKYFLMIFVSRESENRTKIKVETYIELYDNILKDYETAYSRGYFEEEFLKLILSKS